MTAQSKFLPEPVYETEDAECLGGPLDGQKRPVHGAYIRGPFLGRYYLMLVGYTKPNNEIGIHYRYEYDGAWRP